MILDTIISRKKQQLVQEQDTVPLESLRRALEQRCGSAHRSLKDALRASTGLGVIAEVKKASPSKGIIKEDFDPIATAKEYQDCAVAAISVLTEQHFFRGQDAYLQEITTLVDCPVLRKDFIIDPYQVYQSKLLGADCILLIAAALTTAELISLQSLAGKLGLECLVEVHNQEELTRVLDTDTQVVGINNRDLRTFETSLAVTAALMERMPQDRTVVSESGIHHRSDICRLEEFGVDGVLIGESLMRAPSIADKIRELRGEVDG